MIESHANRYLKSKIKTTIPTIIIGIKCIDMYLGSNPECPVEFPEQYKNPIKIAEIPIMDEKIERLLKILINLFIKNYYTL